MTESLQIDSSTFPILTGTLEILVEGSPDRCPSLAIMAETVRIGIDTLRVGAHTFEVCVATLRIVG
jgi:hypothetical protein